ncbi:hypothetical protein RclHR1_07720004 [Rhizophagus clarus]|uniref:Uncharacterized protein n=1 Tax=Rhizophagus clarus TaxID=94130 RepID=A0A2Z6SD16_9GLOM|nr:hypothetical protein RclHR1_07720004 [Rhizophagus clarus]GET02269.1 hypothetical protein GLOIN_2v1765707 [Rhizophagus clarus]
MEGVTVNVCQVSELNDRDGTIRDLAQRIVRDNLGKMEVKEIAMSLIRTLPNAMAVSTCLSRLRRELSKLNASEKIISATYDPETTKLANKMQKECQKQYENEGINYPGHFAPESVKERLDVYVVSNVHDLLALADVMIMLCIRPAEIKTLRIANGDVIGYAKNWGQQDIPRVFISMEKNEEQASQLLTWIQDAISSGQ